MRAAAILLVGPTGSGKTPLGELLEREGFRGRRCRHLDFGARLRRLAAFPDAQGFTAPELETIRRSVSTGALFEDAEFPVATKVFGDFAASAGAELIVLNGFPRHAGQARALEGTIAVELLVLLEAPADVVAERIRLDAEDDRSGRADDSRDEVLNKLETFRERTLPLVEYYSSRGAKVVRISVKDSSTAADHYAALLRQTADD